jgi:hypothetical protein
MSKLLLLAGLLLPILFASAVQGQVTRYAPKVGQPHPDFILPSIEDREAIQLSSFRGKKVLLMHFASW